MNVDVEAVIARAKETFIVDHYTDDDDPRIRAFVVWLLTGEEVDE